MAQTVDAKHLIQQGAPAENANTMANLINHYFATLSAEQAWQSIAKNLLTPQQPFSLHRYLFSLCYPNWQNHPETAPAWLPDDDFSAKTHIAQLMTELNMPSLSALHTWSTEQYPDFWHAMLRKLNIVFRHQPSAICQLDCGVEFPNWLPQATLNISDSCFTAPPTATAIIFPDKNNAPQKMTYDELNRFSNRIANSLRARGINTGDNIAIILPMTVEAVAIYLGIIKIGAVVVSIADSFSAMEIATRLRITKPKMIFTQDIILRGNKALHLYEKIITANAPSAIVLTGTKNPASLQRPQDTTWEKFLLFNDKFTACAVNAMDTCNILFSSGTTADPKAIPWNATTAMKAASDAYLHHDVKTTDILAWPSNLGWMMGPWLIFAALINQATLAVYADTPNERSFGQFIQDAKVTILGVVPTLVASWRQNGCMQQLDWSAIKCFSSTGECSNTEDMLYLMSLAAYRPIIEYCGGTEIGGSYITSTLIEKNCPSTFTTATLGSDFLLLDEQGNPSHQGEIALIPPTLGLSTVLLNADHHKTYFANMPTPTEKVLRRHGDQAVRLANGYYRLLGRIDDTMNLSGIKISATEIERALTGIQNIIETAAIAITPAQGGPSQLVIYAATTQLQQNQPALLKTMQTAINQHLNPLFKIHDLVLIKELPKTASNKIMRRRLRETYQKSARIE